MTVVHWAFRSLNWYCLIINNADMKINILWFNFNYTSTTEFWSFQSLFSAIIINICNIITPKSSKDSYCSKNWYSYPKYTIFKKSSFPLFIIIPSACLWYFPSTLAFCKKKWKRLALRRIFWIVVLHRSNR